MKKDTDKKDGSTEFGDNNPWSLGGNKSKKKTSTFSNFDFGDLDSGNNTFNLDGDVGDTKPTDDAWGFTSVGKKDKKKKGAVEEKKEEEPAPVEPEPKEEDTWGAWGTSTKKKDKKKKGWLDDDPIEEPKPAAPAEPEPAAAEDEWAAFSTKKDKKKSKKGAALEEPVAATKDPIVDAGSTDNAFDWGFGTAKKDKLRRASMHSKTTSWLSPILPLHQNLLLMMAMIGWLPHGAPRRRTRNQRKVRWWIFRLLST